MSSQLMKQIKEVVIFMGCLMMVKFIVAIHTMTHYSEIIGGILGYGLAAVWLSIPVIGFSILWEKLKKNR